MQPSTHPQPPALRCRHGRFMNSLLLHDLHLPNASQPAQRAQGLLDPQRFVATGPGSTLTKHWSCQVSGVKCKVNRTHTEVLSNPSYMHAKNQ